MAPSRKNSRTKRTDSEILEFVRAHERFVRSYLRSLGCPDDRVDDLAQDTFLRVLERAPEACNRAYIATVAANLFRNSLRGRALDPKLVKHVDQVWTDFHRADEGDTWITAMRACVEGLPERTREALQLRYGRDVARDEIAKRLSLSVGGVKSLLLRGKEALRDCVERRLGTVPRAELEVRP